MGPSGGSPLATLGQDHSRNRPLSRFPLNYLSNDFNHNMALRAPVPCVSARHTGMMLGLVYDNTVVRGSNEVVCTRCVVSKKPGHVRFDARSGHRTYLQ
jgi:hypothetical protein